jgi:hypothetical protein
MANLREVREAKSFERKKASLGDILRLDEALSGFIWMASRDPTAFPTIYPNSRVRIAEVGPLMGKDKALTGYMILFREEGENYVDLLWIEEVP